MTYGKRFGANAANILVKAVSVCGLHWMSRKQAALYLQLKHLKNTPSAACMSAPKATSSPLLESH